MIFSHLSDMDCSFIVCDKILHRQYMWFLIDDTIYVHISKYPVWEF